ncbi:hypothetical protein BG60_23730 [Caballeronia zhejiangensis]|uniref:Uncharacterized protein n=1 Tax=Caballeronia zhejiangensis TaxID=871203 RepID=A0A656QAS5_9BURK|nr:hypothetical protein BURK_009091 [Burkholderia sp. SJ98]KDR26311.1 hypothetical protein BG60_23730 [Caballeronia zhejiangensis]
MARLVEREQLLFQCSFAQHNLRTPREFALNDMYHNVIFFQMLAKFAAERANRSLVGASRGLDSFRKIAEGEVMANRHEGVRSRAPVTMLSASRIFAMLGTFLRYSEEITHSPVITRFYVLYPSR